MKLNATEMLAGLAAIEQARQAGADIIIFGPAAAVLVPTERGQKAITDRGAEDGETVDGIENLQALAKSLIEEGLSVYGVGRDYSVTHLVISTPDRSKMN